MMRVKVDDDVDVGIERRASTKGGKRVKMQVVPIVSFPRPHNSLALNPVVTTTNTTFSETRLTWVRSYSAMI